MLIKTEVFTDGFACLRRPVNIDPSVHVDSDERTETYIIQDGVTYVNSRRIAAFNGSPDKFLGAPPERSMRRFVKVIEFTGEVGSTIRRTTISHPSFLSLRHRSDRQLVIDLGDTRRFKGYWQRSYGIVDGADYVIYQRLDLHRKGPGRNLDDPCLYGTLVRWLNEEELRYTRAEMNKMIWGS